MGPHDRCMTTKKNSLIRTSAIVLATGATALSLAACGGNDSKDMPMKDKATQSSDMKKDDMKKSDGGGMDGMKKKDSMMSDSGKG